MYSCILIIIGFVLFSCSLQSVLSSGNDLGVSKSGSYTSYVKRYEDKDGMCNGSCVAIRLGVGIGISSFVVGGVCIPLTTWYCVYKCKQINFRFFKRRGREEDNELITQRADASNWTGDSSSDLEGLED